MRLAPLSALIMMALPALAQDGVAPGISTNSFSEELGLPYWAPGRGEIDYDALRRRELAVIEAQFGAFRTTAHAMAVAARDHCANGTDFTPAYTAARLAWAPLEGYQFGPMEQNGAALRVNFWPDRKGSVRRTVKTLVTLPEDDLANPDFIATQSAAVQGFPALEALIGTDDLPQCPAIIGISGNIARFSDDLYGGWFDAGGWADIVRDAGPDNPVYLDAREFTKEIYTALDFMLIRMRDQSLMRPLGDATGPKPHRAEAWQTDLSLPIINAQLDGITQMIEQGFAGDTREPTRAWVLDVVKQTKARVAKIDMPLTQAVSDPDGIWLVDGLRSKIAYLSLQMAQDIGPDLGVETGFSPADGD